MSNNWQQVHNGLLDFIASHPEIRIDQSGVSIPGDVRDEFYGRFDAVRRAFIEDSYSALPVEVGILSDNYVCVEKELCQLLKLGDISLPIDLLSFLQSPKDGLTRALYNRLFELLQGRITAEGFEQQAIGDLIASATELNRLGYEPWAALALVKLLEPDKGFQVAFDAEGKLIQQELKQISFGRQAHHPALRVPEFVVHSGRLDKYVAIKLELAGETATYESSYGKRRALRRTGDTSAGLDSRVMILSVMTGPEEIPIIADLENQKVFKPDLIVEFLGQTETAYPIPLEQMKHRYDIFQPTLGTYLVSRNPVQEAILAELGENMHFLEVGLDQSKLQSIIDRLAS